MTKMMEGTPQDTEIAKAAGEAVANLVESMLANNSKENEARVEDIRGAFRLGAIQLRASLTFEPTGLVSFMLHSVARDGKMRTISRAEFTTPKDRKLN